jgi:hypothetical protein
MIGGISKRQWLLILAAAVIALLVDAAGIWVTVQGNHAWEALRQQQLQSAGLTGTFRCSYPWLETGLQGLLLTLLLGGAAWLPVFISEKTFFQKLRPVTKFVAELLTSIFAGAVLTALNFLFGASWETNLSCRTILGLSKPAFALFWNPVLVFPAASLLIFLAMYLSEDRARAAKQEEE